MTATTPPQAAHCAFSSNCMKRRVVDNVPCFSLPKHGQQAWLQPSPGVDVLVNNTAATLACFLIKVSHHGSDVIGLVLNMQ